MGRNRNKKRGNKKDKQEKSVSSKSSKKKNSAEMKVLDKIDEVKSTMTENIEAQLGNAEALIDIEAKSNEIKDHAQDFEKKSSDVKSRMRWLLIMKWTILIAIISAVIFFFKQKIIILIIVSLVRR
ncbi:hypothetical protein MHBO_004236 [Bonamia ostreae]|uniref:V-SNARE coiled-coil homology domain-containing protein n=1 Tax=Bonamia ostreae TaxID=126728 RepID=A0ABV2ASQ9_9EUKA